LPPSRRHLRAHEGPARTAGEYKAAVEADPARFDFDPVMEFLYQWLKWHIPQEDMRIAASLWTDVLPD
tara:strand:+ start:428 stop:631 length:204 start_codon:yes stop_codon:yes gene_type:complete